MLNMHEALGSNSPVKKGQKNKKKESLLSDKMNQEIASNQPERPVFELMLFSVFKLLTVTGHE